jgi:phosphonopyruvate decarboxylase
LKRLISQLQNLSIEFITGVPDSTLSAFVSQLQNPNSRFNLQVAPNEGNSIALATGYFLGTGKPALVYMQNSGLPNALNPLASLAHRNVYGIPMLIFIGWRGSYNEDNSQLKDEPQHLVQGAVTRKQLSDLEIPFEIASSNLDVFAQQISKMYTLSLLERTPAAILIGPGILDGPKHANNLNSILPSSENAIRETIRMLENKSVLVGSTGMIGRELLKISQEIPNFPHKIFMNVGAMGHASAIAKGIALARPDIPVLCFDGDGSLAMHFGTIAMLENLSNFKHIIINNNSHDSVGGQATSFGQHNLSTVLSDFAFGRYEQIANLDSDSYQRVKRMILDEKSCTIEFRCSPRTSHNLPRPSKSPQEATLEFLADLNLR